MSTATSFTTSSPDDENRSLKKAFRIFIASLAHQAVCVHQVTDVAYPTSRVFLLFHLTKDRPMAFTPSKDHKRIAREQKKLEKRMAREEAKVAKLEAQRAEEEAAELAAAKQAELDEEARIEAEFEAELKAEEEAKKNAE